MGFSSFVGRCLWSFVWKTIIINPIETKACCCERKKNRICVLPDDLLLHILFFVPTKDAVATSILSKRWRFVWTMLPELEFKDKEGSERSVGRFIDKTLQLHKAPKLESLIIELGPRCRRVDVDDIGKWVEKAVNLSVEVLDFNLLWEDQEELLVRFPKSLYTCDTLVNLTLSNKILVDLSSSVARLPSLLSLILFNVVYKDEETLAKLLSSSPVLKALFVNRDHEDDNLTIFTVRVSSLETLYYSRKDQEYDYDDAPTLVIDCPALTSLTLINVWEDYCLIESNMPCLLVAYLSLVYNLDYKFLRCLSSLVHFQLYLSKSTEVACRNNAIKFSQLIEFYFCPNDNTLDNWLEPLMFFLHNSPKLKTLTINIVEPDSLPPCWNQPSSIPGCLSSHLETFVWREFEGREDEKQLVKYIFANAKCLKKVEISLKSTCNNHEETQKELESMPRISTSSCLVFPTEIEWRYIGKPTSSLYA